MKQITIWSDENNVFTLESQIIDTELTLVISDLNDDADIKLNFSYILEIQNSVVKIVTSKNQSFKKALLATNNATLTHSIGKTKIQETVLTRQEFCRRLMRLRSELKNS